MKEETKLKRKHECINELMFLEKHHRENALKLMDQALKEQKKSAEYTDKYLKLLKEKWFTG